MEYEEAIKQLDYIKQLKQELSTERIKLHSILKEFSALYPKSSTGEFYRKCSYTYNELFTLPSDFPHQLMLADTIQVAIFYSNLSRTVLLYREGYSGVLKEESTHPRILFNVHRDLDVVIQLEHQTELYKYFNYILRNKKNEVQRIKGTKCMKSLHEVVRDLEDRVKVLEYNYELLLKKRK